MTEYLKIMPNKPEVSLIIPVYNVESYLKQCLDSVINQTFKDIEIIIVNDCSCDSSLQIIKEYQQKDERIVLINLQENKGQGNARNEGLKIAKGNYITFIDSDDWVRVDYIETLYKTIKEHNVDLAIANISTYNNITGKISHIKFPPTIYNNLNTKAIKSIILKQRMIWSSCSKIYKKSFILNNNIFFKQILMEDILFNYEVILKTDNIILTDKNLYYYRIKRNLSTMENKSNRIYSCVNVFKNIKQMLINNNQLEKFKSSFYSYGYLCFAAEIEVSSLSKKELNKIIVELKNTVFDDRNTILIYNDEQFIYKCRLFLFNLCLKYNISYVVIGKAIRRFLSLFKH